MGRNIFRRFAITSIIFSCLLWYIEATDVEYELDWSIPALHLTLSSNIPEGTVNQPVALSRLQTTMAQEFTYMLIEVLRNKLIVNSLYTFQELLAEQPMLMKNVLNIPIDKSGFINGSEANLLRGWVQNSVALAPHISSLFVHKNHNQQQLPPILEWHPAAKKSTGIIIYAQDPLPLYGTIRQEYLQPALFPEIMDDDLRIIFGPQFISTDRLHEQASVTYTDQVEQAEHLISRVGLNPIRVVAIGVYGKYPTDIILSKEDADYILASNMHTQLLTQARVAIILAPEINVQKGIINE